MTLKSFRKKLNRLQCDTKYRNDLVFSVNKVVSRGGSRIRERRADIVLLFIFSGEIERNILEVHDFMVNFKDFSRKGGWVTDPRIRAFILLPHLCK